MTEYALLVVIAVLLIERIVSAHQFQTERKQWMEGQAEANRKAFTAVMSRNATEYARAEAVTRITEDQTRNLMNGRDSARYEPTPEGLG